MIDLDESMVARCGGCGSWTWAEWDCCTTCATDIPLRAGFPLDSVFWEKVMSTGMTRCVEWANGRTADGYGAIGSGGVMWRAHRWVWTQVNGPIPSKKVIMHTCDNPPCIRMEHLRLGTQSENMQDKWDKARVRSARKESGEWML